MVRVKQIMDRTSRTAPDWSSLPYHLLAEIAKCFDSVDDVLRFRSISSSFRSSVSSPFITLIPPSVRRTSFPMGPAYARRSHFQLLPVGPTRSRSRANHFLLTESTIYAIEPLGNNRDGSTQTWIVKIEESNLGDIRIKDPLCGYRFKGLSNRLPRSLNLLDYRIKEIEKVYRLEVASVGKGRSKVCRKDLYKKKTTFFVKVVVSTAPEEQFAVLAIHRSGKLVVWKSREGNFSCMDVGDHEDFEDIIYYNKKFYALDYMGYTITLDSKFFKVTRVTKIDRSNGRYYLVKSSDSLLLVFRNWAYEDRRLYFKVYKLDEERNEWVQVVDGLEDRVFFVGEDCSFSVSAKQFPGCKGNCVYFTHNSFAKGNDDHPGMSAGIFNLKDNTVCRLSAFPGYSKIFWPPPTWLNNHGCPS